MPIYEYRCTNCSHVFEVSHEVGGHPGPCPNCGGTPQRIFTSVGLIFKGSGFHATDYRKRGAGNGEAPAETSGKESAETSGKESAETSGKESATTSGKESAAQSKKGAGAVTKSDQ